MVQTLSVVAPTAGKTVNLPVEFQSDHIFMASSHNYEYWDGGNDVEWDSLCFYLTQTTVRFPYIYNPGKGDVIVMGY